MGAFLYCCQGVKGHWAIRLSWTKRHATAKHVEEGITTLEDMKGNAIADRSGEEGVNMHGVAIIHIAKLFSARHKQYTSFMTRVAQHIIEAYMIHRELTRIQEAKKAKAEANQDNRIFYKPLEHPGRNITRKLNITSTVTRYAGILKDMPFAIHVERLLSTIHIAPCTNNLRGVAWLEMYITYRVCGHPKPIADDPCVGRARSNLDAQLSKFKLCVGRLVDRIFINTNEGLLFKPSGSKEPCLAGVGILGQHPSVLFNIHLTTNMQKHVAAVLVAIGRRCTKQKIQEFLSGTHGFNPTKLNLRGKAALESKIPCLEEHEPFVAKPDTSSHGVAQASEGSSQLHVATCPMCNQESPSQRYNLQNVDLDLRIKCIICKRSGPCRLWRCNHGTPWHICAQHGQHQATSQCKRAASEPRTISSGASTCKRLLLNASFEQILDDDLRKEATKAKVEWLAAGDHVITLGTAPSAGNRTASWLSPKLRERFSSSLAAC